MSRKVLPNLDLTEPDQQLEVLVRDGLWFTVIRSDTYFQVIPWKDGVPLNGQSFTWNLKV